MLTVKQLHKILGKIIKNKEVSANAPVMISSDSEGNGFGSVGEKNFSKNFFNVSDGKCEGKRECLVIYPNDDYLEPY